MSSTGDNTFNDSNLDKALRPDTWNEYVGQQTIKDNLQILLTAAKERSHQPEHLLFYGPPGLGKTTLTYLIAKEIGSQIKSTSGPAIERVGDLAAILTNLSEGDVLFIDEIHRLNKTVEEILYPALESGSLDIIIGKGPSARTVQLDLSPFTLVAATTKVAMLSAPLRSRFSGGVFRLDFYNQEEIERIVERSSKVLGIQIDDDAIVEIAKRSRSTPRTANYLLKRCRDYAQVHKQKLDLNSVSSALLLLQIDDAGLTEIDRSLLDTIISKYEGGPVGLGTLAAAISEDRATIEEVNEPYLMQLGLIDRTPRGRVATRAAYEHLGYDVPENIQDKLL